MICVPHAPSFPAREERLPQFPCPPRPIKWVENLEPRVLLTIYTVTTIADDGPGSLRQAMLNANRSGGADEYRFNIPAPTPDAGPVPGLRTIRPASALPELTGPTTIDGNTQPGATGAGHPVVEIDGSAAGPFADGLSFAAASGPNVVRGLAINRFARHGIVTAATQSMCIESNFIGTDATGQDDLGNGGSGVVARGPLILGGLHTATANAGNVISGNEFAGVWVNWPPAGSTRWTWSQITSAPTPRGGARSATAARESWSTAAC